MHERHGHRGRAPGEHDAGQPGAGTVALQQHVGGDFEQCVTDKEQSGTQPVSCCADTQIGFQMAAYKTDIDPVDVIDDEHHHEQRQHVAFHLGGRTGKHRGVRSTRDGIQEATPIHCFFGDESIMEVCIIPVQSS